MISISIRASKCNEKEDRTTFGVTLDDAVEILAGVRMGDVVPRSEYLRPKQTCTMLASNSGKRSIYDHNGLESRGYHRSIRNESRIPNKEESRAQINCMACEKSNHWYRGPECIHNFMKNLVQGKKATRSSSTNCWRLRTYFPKSRAIEGKGRYKRHG